MELKLIIKNTENVANLTGTQLNQIEEIVNALVSTGGLSGVKGGQTIIHFDGLGTFQGIEIAYWPFRRRKIDTH